MTRADVLSALAGDSGSPAFGLTWLPEDLGPAVGAADAGADFVFVTSGGTDMRRQVAALRAVDVASFVVVPGPVGMLAKRDGWTEVMKRSATETFGLAAELTTLARQASTATRDALDAGADAVVIADDLAHPGGWLLDPDFVEGVVIALESQAAAPALDARTSVIFHSDGDISTLYPALAESGFHGVHLATGEPAGVAHVLRAARSYGLAALGGISAAQLDSSPSRVADGVRRLLAEGLVLVCDDGGVTSQTQFDALEQVFRLLRLPAV